jgi:sterol 3beta-glucosyltransferase
MGARRVTVLAIGSRGDVDPLAALGTGLAGVGCEVRLVTTADADVPGPATAAGVEAVRLPGKLRPVVSELAAAGADPRVLAQRMRAALVELAPAWAEQGLAACVGSDVIIAGSAAVYLGTSFGEKLGVPAVEAHVAFGALRTELQAARSPLANRYWHHLIAQMLWQSARPAVNGELRPRLGLPRYPALGPQYRRRRDAPVLFGISPAVVPVRRPLPAHAAVTGFWFLPDPAGPPPPAVAEFLARGEPPVYVGFGSMTGARPDELTALVVDAVGRTGRRAVLAVGGGAVAGVAEEYGDRLLVVPDVPHSWLLPRVALAVHHAGAGTTAAALRAGIPSVPVPFMGDQRYWAQRLVELGAAGVALDRRRLTADALADAIDRASAAPVRERAARLGEQVRAEDGPAAAAAALRFWGMIDA